MTDFLALGHGETLQLMRSLTTHSDMRTRYKTNAEGESVATQSILPSSITRLVEDFKEVIGNRTLVVGNHFYNDGHDDLDRMFDRHHFEGMVKKSALITLNPTVLNHIQKKLESVK